MPFSFTFQKQPDLRRSQSEVNHQTAAQHSPEQASLSHSSKPSRSSVHVSTAYSSSSSAHVSTTHSSRPSGAFGSSGGAKHPSRSSLIHEYDNSNLRDTCKCGLPINTKSACLLQISKLFSMVFGNWLVFRFLS